MKFGSGAHADLSIAADSRIFVHFSVELGYVQHQVATSQLLDVLALSRLLNMCFAMAEARKIKDAYVLPLLTRMAWTKRYRRCAGVFLRVRDR